MQEEKVVENESEMVADNKPVSEPIESFVQPEETKSEGSEWAETVSQPITTTHAKTVAELASNLFVDSKALTKNDNIAAPLTLPNVIDAEDRPACQRHFQQLDEQQQKDVLTVFNQQLKTGSIKSKTKYFIGLTKKAQQGGLTVPSAAKQTASTTSSTIAINSPEHFAMLKEANKEQEARALLWSDYQGLKQLALLNKTSEQETAVIMGMEDAYAAFGQQEALDNTCAV